MINAIFDVCKWLPVLSADRLGRSYRAINVWIFVSLWPAYTLGWMAARVGQHLKIRRRLRQIAGRRPASHL
jgi:hypothetical protein